MEKKCKKIVKERQNEQVIVAWLGELSARFRDLGVQKVISGLGLPLFATLLAILQHPPSATMVRCTNSRVDSKSEDSA